MGSKVRVPNKAGWALDELLTEHDPEVAELMRKLMDQVQVEKEAAERRYDTRGRLRVAEILLTVARLQDHLGRSQRLHHLARQNEYDRR